VPLRRQSESMEITYQYDFAEVEAVSP